MNWQGKLKYLERKPALIPLFPTWPELRLKRGCHDGKLTNRRLSLVQPHHIIAAIKLRKLKWTEHVACIEVKNPVENIGRKPPKICHFKHPGVYLTVILKWVVEKHNFEGECGLSRLRIGPRGETLPTRQWHLRFYWRQTFLDHLQGWSSIRSESAPITFLPANRGWGLSAAAPVVCGTQGHVPKCEIYGKINLNLVTCWTSWNSLAICRPASNKTAREIAPRLGLNPRNLWHFCRAIHINDIKKRVLVVQCLFKI